MLARFSENRALTRFCVWMDRGPRMWRFVAVVMVLLAIGLAPLWLALAGLALIVVLGAAMIQHEISERRASRPGGLAPPHQNAQQS